jgi:hypothetical protein
LLGVEHMAAGLAEGVEGAIDGAVRKAGNTVADRMQALAKLNKMHCCSRKGHVLNPPTAGRATAQMQIYREVRDHGACCSKCTVEPDCTAWEYSSTGVCITRRDTPSSHLLVSPELQTWTGRPFATEACGGAAHKLGKRLTLKSLASVYHSAEGAARVKQEQMRRQEQGWRKRVTNARKGHREAEMEE